MDELRAINRLGVDDWTEDGIHTEDAARLHSIFGQWRARLTGSENS